MSDHAILGYPHDRENLIRVVTSNMTVTLLRLGLVKRIESSPVCDDAFIFHHNLFYHWKVLLSC